MHALVVKAAEKECCENIDTRAMGLLTAWGCLHQSGNWMQQKVGKADDRSDLARTCAGCLSSTCVAGTAWWS
jgi:hypothetical protein